MSDNKRFWSYEQVHELVRRAVVEEAFWDDWRPTLIICIAAGGFVPTRILRSFLKHKYGSNTSIQTIGLQLYDVEGCDPNTSPVQRVQWLSYGTGPGQVLLQGHRILLVDEVDDSRKTLAHAIAELEADIEQEKQQHIMTAAGQPWQAPELGVFVLHNKLRPKLAQLPNHIMSGRYWVGLDIENCWCVYPWDALHIYDHTSQAEAAGLPASAMLVPHRAKRQSSGCPPPPSQAVQPPNLVNSNGVHSNGCTAAAAAATAEAPAAASNGVHALLNGV